MADPTREQFDAASKKVMASAPAGLTREQFYALIDKELAPPPTATGMREKGLGQGAVTDESGNPVKPAEPTTYSGGFLKSIKDDLTSGANRLVNSPMMQGAAHPQSLGDMAPLILPASVGESGPSVIKLLQAAKRGAVETTPGATRVLRMPINAVRSAAQWANTPARDLAQKAFNDIPLAQQMEMGALPETGASGRSVRQSPTQVVGLSPQPGTPLSPRDPGWKPSNVDIQAQMHEALVKGMQDSHPEMPTTMAGPGESVQQDIIPPAHGDASLVAPGQEGAFNAAQQPEPMPSHVPTPAALGAPNTPGTIRPPVPGAVSGVGETGTGAPLVRNSSMDFLPSTVKPSASHDAMSQIPGAAGMSVNDVKAVTPGLAGSGNRLTSIKAMSPELKAFIEKQRGLRHTGYRDDAVLNRQFKDNTDQQTQLEAIMKALGEK